MGILNRLVLAVAFVGMFCPLAAADLLMINAGPANDLLFDVDPLTGTATNSRATGQNGDVSGLAFDGNSDTLYGITQFDALISIDTITGVASTIGSVGVNSGGYGLAYDTINDVLFASDSLSRELWTLNTTTGVRTVVGTTAPRLVGLAYDPTSDLLFGVASDTNAVYEVDTSTGGTTFVGALGITIGSSTGLAYDAALNKLFLSDTTTSSIYEIDSSGNASLVGSHGLSGNFSGLTSNSVAAVPEPSSLTLFSIFAFSALAQRRRRHDRDCH